MFSVRKSVDIDFGHIVAGHPGACISPHGHTWKFEVTAAATHLDPTGFVVDFKLLKERVLVPVHLLLDHGFAVGQPVYSDAVEAFAMLGEVCMNTRTPDVRGVCTPGVAGELNGARNVYPGGIKLAVFPFNPTSEKLAKWLFEIANAALADDRVSITRARVYETLHPVEAVAEYAAE